MIFVYRRLLINDNWLGSIARYFKLDLIFTETCNVIGPSSLINKYIIGGGFYKCENYPISTNYIYVSLILVSLIIFLFLAFYKLSFRLEKNQRIIFNRTLFFTILLPSTSYYLLAFHTDNLYNFIIFPFIFLSFYFSFIKKFNRLIPISIVPFLIIYFSNSVDNQFIIYIFLLASYQLAYILHKKFFFINILNSLSEQFLFFLNLNFYIYKKIFFILFIFISVFIVILLSNRIELLNFFSYSLFQNFPITENIQRISELYTNQENIFLTSTVDKYPIFLRLFGLLQGLVLVTPYGIKPSIFSTFFIFSSFLLGFLRCYSYGSVVPLFLKIFFLILFLSTVIIVSIFPFFSFAKYWLFFLPFAGLFMSFTPRISIISIGLIYLELILKSTWLN